MTDKPSTPIEKRLSPWSDAGWKESSKAVRRSPCCGDAIWASRADGVTVGSCAKCFRYVRRINPKTGKQEIPATEVGGSE